MKYYISWQIVLWQIKFTRKNLLCKSNDICIIKLNNLVQACRSGQTTFKCNDKCYFRCWDKDTVKRWSSLLIWGASVLAGVGLEIPPYNHTCKRTETAFASKHIYMCLHIWPASTYICSSTRVYASIFRIWTIVCS